MPEQEIPIGKFCNLSIPGEHFIRRIKTNVTGFARRFRERLEMDRNINRSFGTSIDVKRWNDDKHST